MFDDISCSPPGRADYENTFRNAIDPGLPRGKTITLHRDSGEKKKKKSSGNVDRDVITEAHKGQL